MDEQVTLRGLLIFCVCVCLFSSFIAASYAKTNIHHF